jgi:hypothetical protein
MACACVSHGPHFRGRADAYSIDLGDDELDLRLLARRDREERGRVDHRQQVDSDFDVGDDLQPERRHLGGDVQAGVENSIDVCDARMSKASEYGDVATYQSGRAGR